MPSQAVRVIYGAALFGSVVAFPAYSTPRRELARRPASIMEPWTILPQPTEAFHDAGRPVAAVTLSPLAFQIMAHCQAHGVIETEAPVVFRDEHVERPLL